MDTSKVNAVLDPWRQGDALVEADLPFVTLALAELPLTPASLERAENLAEGDDHVLDVITAERGIVVLSQTCDIVREAGIRPFVEIAPLIEVEDDDYYEIKRGRRLQYLAIPALAGQRLVGDLDRVMTIEKPLLAAIGEHKRVAGCSTDAERRELARALARRRSRFAFPDDFVAAMRKIVDHVVAKHDRNSELGLFMRCLTDLRVECTDWEAEPAQTTLLFIFRSLADVPANAQRHAEDLVKRFTPTGKFDNLRFQVVTLENMTAARHLETDALDLEHLSAPRPAV